MFFKKKKSEPEVKKIDLLLKENILLRSLPVKSLF